MRIFERATGGGLGRGSFGVVLWRPGGGKTAFLIGLALDALLHGRKVLHISTQESVERLNDFYDQIFQRPRRAPGPGGSAGAAARGGAPSPDPGLQPQALHAREARAVGRLPAPGGRFRALLRDPGRHPALRDDRALGDRRHPASGARVGRRGLDRDPHPPRGPGAATRRGVPLEVARYDDALALIVVLKSRDDHVRVRVLKDHDRAEVPELRLELDPHDAAAALGLDAGRGLR